MVLERGERSDDFRSQAPLRSARGALGPPGGRLQDQSERERLPALGIGHRQPSRPVAQLRPRRHEGRDDVDWKLGRLSGARRRRSRALSDRQHVRLRRRFPVRQDPHRPEGRSVLRRPGAVLRFREDAEPGQQHGVHRSALPHLRGAAGGIPGELPLSIRERAYAVAHRQSNIRADLDPNAQSPRRRIRCRPTPISKADCRR